LKPAPYLLGREMTALDVYAAMLSRWEPGRAWVDEHCRQVAAAGSETLSQNINFTDPNNENSVLLV